ncbi:MAG: HepT-like ribonuclease domain-containing protein, partial [Candidatus Binatia bacterium]
LVHEYARIDDLLVYEAATQKLSDFEAFKREMIQALDRLVRSEG